MRRAFALALVAFFAAGPSRAEDAGAPPQPAAESGCIEHVPSGKTRPELREAFPAKGVSGHAVTLELTLEHGKGETVLPGGIQAQLGGPESKPLERAGFFLAHPDGGAGASLNVLPKGERATTTLKVPLVPLPPEPGRHELTLPSLPIAVARASGEVITLCTKPHAIQIEDPIANSPDPKPLGNPLPRRQLEEWTTLKHVTVAALAALIVGALVAFLVGRWLRRPKPTPPPPPPRPPWEVALEELFDTRHAGLIKTERYAEHFDRVSDCVRKYLGARFGFDGLESTTREMLAVLRNVKPPIDVLQEIERFLRQADLVKFARLTPTELECEHALLAGEEVVRRTMPLSREAEKPDTIGENA